MSLNSLILLACFLFVIGLMIVLIRKELLFILMGIEVMFNAATLIAVASVAYWQDGNGQVLALFIMIAAGAELAVALLLTMFCYRHLKIRRTDQLNKLRDRLSTESL